MIPERSAPKRQSGAALLIVLSIVVTAGVASLLVFVSPRTAGDESDRITSDALAEARSALILRAALDDNRPGSLPCPDQNNDGIAELLSGSNCTGGYIGRLPWKTLNLPDLRDASGERLWYALAPALRDDISAQPINSVSIGTPQLLSIVGTAPMADVAAVVIAPGKVLSGQVRDAAGENNATNYLEGNNANGDAVYQSALVSESFNDTVAAITRDHLFQVVEWRVAREIRQTLRNYYTSYGYFPFANDYASGGFACTSGQTRGRLPNPDPATFIADTCPTNANWGGGLSTPPPAWFFANQWHLLTYYSLAPACTSAAVGCSGAGFISVKAPNAPPLDYPIGNVRAVVIVGGRAIGFQARPCKSASDCIEQAGAGSDQYVVRTTSAAFNDRVAIVAP